MSRQPPPSPPAGPAAEFFAVEVRTAAWETLLAWYREVLGLPVLLRVTDDGYALLGDARGRIALEHAADIVAPLAEQAHARAPAASPPVAASSWR